MRVLAYVYPGWHPIPERDASFYPGFTEWDLVVASPPRFAGHVQPRLPALGRYDDRDPAEVQERLELARRHGVDGVTYGFFWCRGKRVFQEALDDGFLRAPLGSTMPFSLLWANRMPRRVLPVRRVDTPVIEADRLVPSDVDDFVALLRTLAPYFARPNYVRVDGRVYFSIFDSTFFVNELGVDGATEAIRRGRSALRALGLELHLGAVEPNDEVIGRVRDVGFDSVTHYVFLPDWKGPFLQDYDEMATLRASQWPRFAERSGLPYFPSVAPGWDASPRAADFGVGQAGGPPRKYPWWPIVTGESPQKFEAALRRAVDYAHATSDELVFVASLNEWSEGHYLEPDTRFGFGWLEAVRAGRS
jgi:hypothetical protein